VALKKKNKWQPDEELGTTDIKTTDKTGSACLYSFVHVPKHPY
jgi:hypothetical protein